MFVGGIAGQDREVENC